MNGMQLSSNIITVLAWPIVVILALIVYRDWIMSSVPAATKALTKGRLLKRAKIGPVEIEWSTEIGTVGEDVGSALKSMPPDAAESVPVPTSLVDLIEDVNSSPRSGIRKAFFLVRKALDQFYPDLASVPQERLPGAISDLARRGVLHPDVENAIVQLQKLLDRSNTDAEVDKEQGYLFLLLAEGAIHGILRSAKIHASEIAHAPLADGLTPIRPSWRGWYNRDFIIELHIHQWHDSGGFDGEMNYPGSGTTTSVTGYLAAIEPGGGQTPIVWQERAYVTTGNRSVELTGEYQAIVSGDVIAGSWYRGDQRIAGFELTSVSPGD
jgi:hypothetical protein